MITFGTLAVAAWVIFTVMTSRYLEDAHRTLLTTWVLVSLYLNSGYFLKVNSTVVTYDEAVLVVAIFTGLLAMVPRSFGKRYVLLAIALLFSVTLGIALLEWHPVDFLVMPPHGSWDFFAAGIDQRVYPQVNTDDWMRLLRVCLFIVAYAQIEQAIFRRADRRDRLQRVVVIGAAVAAGIAMLEFISWHLFGRDYVLDFVRGTFGQLESQVTVPAVLAGNAISLQGLMREPSHLAAGFFPAIVILLLTDSIPRSWSDVTLFSILAVVLMSGSLTGVLLVTFAVVIWIWRRRRAGDFLKVGGLLVVTVAAFAVARPATVNLWYERVARSLSYLHGGAVGLSITSETVRLTSIEHALAWFYARPLLGVGIGSGVVHGALPNILSGVGIIGFVLWLKLLMEGNAGAGLRNRTVLVFYLMVLIFVGDIGYMYSAHVAIVFLSAFQAGRPSLAEKPEIGLGARALQKPVA